MASCQVSQGFASSALRHFKLKSTDWSNLENTWAKCLPPPAASCSMSSWAMTLWPFACWHCKYSKTLLIRSSSKVVLEFPHPIWNPLQKTSCTRSQPFCVKETNLPLLAATVHLHGAPGPTIAADDITCQSLNSATSPRHAFTTCQDQGAKRHHIRL